MAPATRHASRAATHAGSWYTASGQQLRSQLRTWLDGVDGSYIAPPDRVVDRLAGKAGQHEADPPVQVREDRVEMPVDGCRAIIAPHAGYSYSGETAAWAYKCIDTKAIKRVFILGPSHHVYLDGCALSACASYETPVGSLPLDLDTIAELRATGRFDDDMSLQTDEDEHSIEMHLPYLRHVFEGVDVKIVPILVGSISTAKEAAFGELLAPYLADRDNFFVVSSDFCHWGSRFSYTYYRPGAKATPTSFGRLAGAVRQPSPDYAIHRSIRDLDGEGIAALTFPQRISAAPAGRGEGGRSSDKTAADAFADFAEYLRRTKNTVCGRHPIGVLFGALRALERSGADAATAADTGKAGKWECRFTRYEQSSQCFTPRDSSVSYASAYVSCRPASAVTS